MQPAHSMANKPCSHQEWRWPAWLGTVALKPGRDSIVSGDPPIRRFHILLDRSPMQQLGENISSLRYNSTMAIALSSGARGDLKKTALAHKMAGCRAAAAVRSK